MQKEINEGFWAKQKKDKVSIFTLSCGPNMTFL